MVGVRRAMLCVASLLYAAHAGASLYEMWVVTPHWATDPPQSVRDWSLMASAAMRAMAYQEPAVVALGTISLIVLWLSMWRTAARGWMMLAGALGLALVASTILFGFPILEGITRDGGAGSPNEAPVAEVQAWQMWCKVRLALLLAAWAASLAAVVKSSRPSGTSFHSSIRL